MHWRAGREVGRSFRTMADKGCPCDESDYRPPAMMLTVQLPLAKAVSHRTILASSYNHQPAHLARPVMFASASNDQTPSGRVNMTTLALALAIAGRMHSSSQEPGPAKQTRGQQSIGNGTERKEERGRRKFCSRRTVLDLEIYICRQ